MDYSEFITWGISGIALTLSALSLYLQRRDKRPRLRVSFERTFVEMPKTNHAGGRTYRPLPSLKIHVRNPTERTIKITSVHFVDTEKRHCVLPKHWCTFDEVPPHDKRTLSIPLIEFNDWAKVIKLPNPEKGKFVITDALEYEYKTPKLGNISLEAVDKL